MLHGVSKWDLHTGIVIKRIQQQQHARGETQEAIRDRIRAKGFRVLRTMANNKVCFLFFTCATYSFLTTGVPYCVCPPRNQPQHLTLGVLLQPLFGPTRATEVGNKQIRAPWGRIDGITGIKEARNALQRKTSATDNGGRDFFLRLFPC